MTSRKEFEAHIRKQFPTASDDLLLGRSSNGRYGSMVTEHAWLAWQAATNAALAAPATAPAHTEAEVQELLHDDREMTEERFEISVRRILGVPAP